MSYKEVLGQHAVAISISESPDMSVLGMSDEHLMDAMAEVARHLLALGARLAYGGDLRLNGFSELLFELVARHRRDADTGDNRPGVVDYLAWPVHIQMTVADIESALSDLVGTAELVLLGLDGSIQSLEIRRHLPQQQPTESEWSSGLTAMRNIILGQTQARIVLGGRVEQYKGAMPGIAECRRAFKTDQLCALNFDQGLKPPVIGMAVDKCNVFAKFGVSSGVVGIL